jgi:hypothetical protein
MHAASSGPLRAPAAETRRSTSRRRVRSAGSLGFGLLDSTGSSLALLRSRAVLGPIRLMTKCWRSDMLLPSRTASPRSRDGTLGVAQVAGSTTRRALWMHVASLQGCYRERPIDAGSRQTYVVVGSDHVGMTDSSDAVPSLWPNSLALPCPLCSTAVRLAGLRSD